MLKVRRHERRKTKQNQGFLVIARSKATKQSTLPSLPDGLLRYARNDDSQHLEETPAKYGLLTFLGSVRQ
jgi:hypothetical protein